MKEKIRELLRFLHSSDKITWAAHGVLGLILGFLCGWVFVLGWFTGQEIRDLVNWYREPVGERRTFREKAFDGFMDWIAPVSGAGIATVLKAVL